MRGAVGGRVACAKTTASSVAPLRTGSPHPSAPTCMSAGTVSREDASPLSLPNSGADSHGSDPSLWAAARAWDLAGRRCITDARVPPFSAQAAERAHARAWPTGGSVAARPGAAAAGRFGGRGSRGEGETCRGGSTARPRGGALARAGGRGGKHTTEPVYWRAGGGGGESRAAPHGGRAQRSRGGFEARGSVARASNGGSGGSKTIRACPPARVMPGQSRGRGGWGRLKCRWC